MKFLFSLVALVLSLGSQANTIELETPENEQELNEFISDLRNKKIPQLEQIHKCYLSANFLADIYSNTKSQWIGKSTSSKPLMIYANEMVESDFDLNIFNNFDGIVSSEKELEASIIQFIHDHDPINLDKDAIRDHLSKIDAGQTKLADSLLKASQRESMFLYLVSRAETQLLKFDSTYAPHIAYIKSESCENSNVVPLLMVFQDDIKESLKNIKKLNDYVVGLRPKRNKLIAQVLDEVRNRLLRQHAILSFDDLEEVQKQFLEIIRLDNLGAEMIGWWQGQSANGLADNLHLKYLEYERPLRRLRLIAAKLHHFRIKINSLENTPQSSRDIYLKKLDSMDSALQRNLVRLEDSGWQGQKDRQILINQRRMEKPQYYSEGCIRDIEKHLSYARQTDTIVRMSQLEKLYRDSVESCSRR